jgi:hypothetical protein
VNGVASIRNSILSQCYYIEPEYENWLSIVYIDSKGELKEEYVEIHGISFDVISLAQNRMILHRNNKYAFTLLKLKDKYFINIHKTFYTIYFRRLNQKMNDIKNNNTGNECIKCKYTFLSITYKINKNEISIDFDPGYYMIGNTVLTPAFIYRELSYKNLEQNWSLDYTIDVLDQNLSIFTIHSDQYILLEKDNYKIITTDSDYSDSIMNTEEDNIGMEII